MHLVLTDHLTCPHCGPEHGLILLAERLEERRVLEGRLGCAACRTSYPIRGGFADLRAEAAAQPAERVGAAGEQSEAGEAADAGEAAAVAEADADSAVRWAALLGVTDGRGFVLLAGEEARLAAELARVVEGLEVVAVDAALASWPEQAGVNRMAADAGLPFYAGSLRGVGLSGSRAGEWLEEGARVVHPQGRLVLSGAPADAESRLRSAGFERTVREGAVVVAARQ